MRRRDFWGAAVVPTWYAEATDVLDLDARERPLTDLVGGPSEIQVGADGLGSITTTTRPPAR